MEKKNDMLKTIIIAVCAAVAAVTTIVIIAKVLKKKKAAVCGCADEYCDFDDDDCFCELCEDDITECCGCCDDDDIEVEITEEADAQ